MSQFSDTLKRMFSRIPSFSKSGRFSLTYLNITQFLGVINDNVFKLVMAFLLIDTLGYSKASVILSATGAVYVIPFLLFSASAGILADRFSKQKLLVVMKIAEITIMSLAIIAFTVKSVWACYGLLFVLSTHSAIFGPSKYGIIPELVRTDDVSRANGVITGFTYLAIIIGTFLASFLTEATDRHFTYIAIFCLVIAIGGFFSALAVKPTPAQGSAKKMNLLFIRDIYYTLKYTRTVRHLFPSILGSAYFLVIGAFTQLNIIPFALQALNLSEVAGGYLFLATALGIAAGSFIAGKVSRKQVELGLSCFAGFGIAIFFFLLYLFSASFYLVIACMMAVGIFGGMFIVPFDTFNQLNSQNEKRGQTIAAANFLSFTGVLIASISLYVFNQLFNLSSAQGFGIMGVITFVVSIIFTLSLSDLFLSFFARKILKPLSHFEFPNVDTLEIGGQETIFVLEHATWRNALLLNGSFRNLHFLVPQDSKKWRWYHRFFYSIHAISSEKKIENVIADAKSYAEQGFSSCILLEGTLPKKHENSARVIYVRPYKQKETHTLTFQFERE